MLIMGVFGSIVLSLYIKKTNDYKKVLRLVALSAIVFNSILFTWLEVSAMLGITIIIIGVVGFTCTPIITLCYDLGCELAFPMG